MTDLFPPRPAPRLPIAGDSRVFPVNRIFCIGRNYAAHAAEMKSEAKPIFFMKPGSALWQGETLPYPAATEDLHHEVELVLALGEGGAIIASGVGVDLTRRDRQGEMKDRKGPWEVAKAFPASAPMAALRLGPPPERGEISLSVNGVQRQSGDLAEMILKPDAMITALQTFFDPGPGDLVFTGTPAGVAALVPGDQVEARIAGLPSLQFSLRQAG